jgi:hypothetical protein
MSHIFYAFPTHLRYIYQVFSLRGTSIETCFSKNKIDRRFVWDLSTLYPYYFL